MLETITTSMYAGDPVVIPGFGSFTVRARAARIGRNPRTGAAITIAARKRVHFSLGKGLALTTCKAAQ